MSRPPLSSGGRSHATFPGADSFSALASPSTLAPSSPTSGFGTSSTLGGGLGEFFQPDQPRLPGTAKLVTSRRADSHHGLGLRGVSYVSSSSLAPWKATINHLGNVLDLGCYLTEVEAAQAYDAKARELHGEKARLNFPGQGERSSLGRSSYRGISYQPKCGKWEVSLFPGRLERSF